MREFALRLGCKMDFLVGIFVLAYGVAAVWAIMVNEVERRAAGLLPGDRPTRVPVMVESRRT